MIWIQQSWSEAVCTHMLVVQKPLHVLSCSRSSQHYSLEPNLISEDITLELRKPLAPVCDVKYCLAL